MRKFRFGYDVIYEGPGVVHEHFVKMEYLDKIDRKYDPKIILEIGNCVESKSAGIDSVIFLMRRKEIIFIDMLLNNLKLAKKLDEMFCRKSELIRASPMKLPFRPNCFDLVFSSCVLDYVDSPKLILKEIVRVTRGFLLICSTNRLHVAHFLHKFFHSIMTAPWEKAKNLMTFWDLRRLVEEEGVEVIDGGGIDMPPILSCWVKLGEKNEKSEFQTINPRKNPLMFKLLSLFCFFEKSMPQVVKILQAHMVYILAEV